MKNFVTVVLGVFWLLLWFIAREDSSVTTKIVVTIAGIAIPVIIIELHRIRDK